MSEIKAPESFAEHEGRKVFLAGSIEMGAAEDWQAKVAEGLSDLDVVVLNPRRDDWDSSWVQGIENEQFREQVEWELAGIEAADLVLFYFAPETNSPVTLLELGLCAGQDREIVVCCPDGFWRKGNVDVVCSRFGKQNVADLNELISVARTALAHSRL